MGFLYFNTNFAVFVHDDIIERTGGLNGYLNLHLLESIIGHIQNDFYYQTLEDKVTHLLFSVVKNHCFRDGNKRSSLALSAYFLTINGLDVIVSRFIREMENYVVAVADNSINKELLSEIITSLIYEDSFSETLKLKIYHAIS